MRDITQKTVAVIGLGYVGLPLALAFGRKLRTIGFDINPDKLNTYRQGIDPTGEMTPAHFAKARNWSSRTSLPTWVRPISSSSPCPRTSTMPSSPTSRR